jgi:hypothetical protein
MESAKAQNWAVEPQEKKVCIYLLCMYLLCTYVYMYVCMYVLDALSPHECYTDASLSCHRQSTGLLLFVLRHCIN